MEIQEKHKLKILSYKSTYVSILEEIENKSNYGEDIDCCANELFLASKLINRLECYCFSDSLNHSTEILSSFLARVNNLSLTTIGEIYSLMVNGIHVTSFISTGVETRSFIMANMLNSIGYKYTVSSSEILPTDTYTITAPCNVNKLSGETISPGGSPIVVSDLITVTAGQCAYNGCSNCINDSNLAKMYEVLDNLLN